MASIFNGDPPSLFGKGTTAVGDLFQEDENNEDESSFGAKNFKRSAKS